MQNLIQYIFIAILSWVPIRNLTPYGETEDEARARLHSVAEDIVTIAMDKSEPSVFARADGRVKTALLQASIASMETGFQKFVDTGDCNQANYRADRRGNCDGGHAFSLWQIHVFGGGYLLLEDGTLGSVMYSPSVAQAHPEWIIKGADLVSDRKKAIRVAQRSERASLNQFHSLCGYSGEHCEDGEHPKAKARFDRAVEYYQKHPFTDPIPEPVDLATIASNAAPVSTDSSD